MVVTVADVQVVLVTARLEGQDRIWFPDEAKRALRALGFRPRKSVWDRVWDVISGKKEYWETGFGIWVNL